MSLLRSSARYIPLDEKEEQSSLSSVDVVPDERAARPITSSVLRRQLPIIACLLLHTLLVLAFIFLIVKQSTSPSGIIHVRDNWLFEQFFHHFAPNVIVKVYTIILVHLTQMLAFKRLLYIRQSLTAIHDKTSAWLSLPSAGVALFHYRDIFTRKGCHANNIFAFGGVFTIFLYFGASTLLGFYAPTLVYTNYEDRNQPSTLQFSSVLHDIGQSQTNRIREAYPAVNAIRPVFNTLTKNLGMSRNLIYDVPTTKASQVVWTNASQFVVKCGRIPDATVLFDDKEGSFWIRFADDLEDLQLIPASERSFQIMSPIFKQTGFAPPTIIVATSLPLVDKYNDLPPPIALGQTITPVGCANQTQCGSYSQTYILGCNVEVNTTRVKYDTYYQVPLYDYAGVAINSSRWANSPWSVPTSLDSHNTILSLISQFPHLSPLSPRVLSYRVGRSNSVFNYTRSMLEDQAVELTIGLEEVNVRSLSVEYVSDALERAIAIVYWRAAADIIYSKTDTQAARWIPNYQYTFQVNYKTAVISAALSFVMLILSLLLIRLPIGGPSRLADEEKITSLGLLQAAWLMGKHLWIAEEVAKVSPSPSSKLREQGKKIVQRFVHPKDPKSDDISV